MKEPSSDPAGAAQFTGTHWSIVLAAGHQSHPACRQALAALCRAYWFPLYSYARRRVWDAHQAQDLTQEFFAELLEKNYLAVASPERGRFRAFLLTAFKHFMANEWEKARAQKRCGGVAPISLDFVSGETRYAVEPAGELTPDRAFERQWALSLLDRVLGQLREDFACDGKLDQFERLKVFITPQASTASHGDVARELGMTEGAVAVAVHRLRRRYRELLRGEIAQTVALPGEVEDEIRCLFAAFGS
jgi:DNA-directed RNA polymerase specialized sigma24 family protein